MSEWISLKYRNQDNRECGHTTSVSRLSELRQVMQRYRFNKEDITEFSFNGKEVPLEEVREKL
jgi:tyrosyl-tRNA synthetase